MSRWRRLALVMLALGAMAWLASCAPATIAPPEPTFAPQNTEPASEATEGVGQTQVVEATEPPQATQAPVPGTATSAPVSTLLPLPTASALPSTPGPTATPVVEPRVVELEWPPQMRLGESDVVRLSLVPSAAGYEVVTEFDEHTILTRTVEIEQLAGYELWGVARLDAVGFQLAPAGVLAGSAATWRWTLRPNTGGQHRLSVQLRLRWTPLPANPNPPREVTLYDRAVTVQVLAFFGLTTREAAVVGMAGLAFGTTLSLPLAAYLLRPRRARGVLQALEPNPGLVIEQPTGLALSRHETDLLRALFKPYARLCWRPNSARATPAPARSWPCPSGPMAAPTPTPSPSWARPAPSGRNTLITRPL